MQLSVSPRQFLLDVVSAPRHNCRCSLVGIRSLRLSCALTLSLWPLSLTFGRPTFALIEYRSKCWAVTALILCNPRRNLCALMVSPQAILCAESPAGAAFDAKKWSHWRLRSGILARLSRLNLAFQFSPTLLHYALLAGEIFFQFHAVLGLAGELSAGSPGILLGEFCLLASPPGRTAQQLH